MLCVCVRVCSSCACARLSRILQYFLFYIYSALFCYVDNRYAHITRTTKRHLCIRNRCSYFKFCPLAFIRLRL